MKSSSNARPRPAGRAWLFLLPRSFDPIAALPNDLRKYGDEASFLVNVICRKLVHREVDAEGYVRLDSRILRRFINWRASSRIYDSLVSAGILELSSHLKDVRCRGYRLTAQYLGDGHIYRHPTKPLIVRKFAELRREVMAKQELRVRPIHRRLNEIQHEHLTICLSEAEAILQQLPPRSRFCQGVLVANLLSRQLGNSVGGTGRWFNALTGIKRELRTSLRIGGDNLANVDLVSCQPALLGLLAITLRRKNVSSIA